jgi:HK97 family phage portal protein
MCHLLLWGNAFLMKVRNGAGQVVDLQPLHPSRVSVKLKDGSKIFVVKPVNPESPEGTDQNQTYTPLQVMHIPGLGYDGLVGLSPIAYARQAIGTALAGDKLAARFYSNGTQLSGIIKTAVPLTSEDQADEIKRTWAIKNSGTAAAGQVAVLDAETDYVPLTIPPDQLQFLESRRWQTTEIARMFGIPPHLVGDVEKSTSWGTGIEQQNTAFVAYTLAAWANRIEQRVSREVITGRNRTAAFNFASLLRGDMQERFLAYASGIQWGHLTRNEARLAEDREPIDGLDEPLTPLNMISGKVKIDPMTGEPTPTPANDMDGPLTTTTKPGSGKTQALDEASGQTTHNS